MHPWSNETSLHLLSSTGTYGPDEGWTSAYPECRERNQSPINILDQDTKVSAEYQDLTLEGFDTESSNKTSMKNTGKTGKDNTSSCCILEIFMIIIIFCMSYVWQNVQHVFIGRQRTISMRILKGSVCGAKICMNNVRFSNCLSVVGSAAWAGWPRHLL